MNLRFSFYLVGLSVLFSGCMSDADLKLPYYGFNPNNLEDGWELSLPNSQGLDDAAIENIYLKLFNENEFPSIRSLLLVRHGTLVGEAYMRDTADQSRYHHVQSVTKSVVSLLAGIAIDNGDLTGLDAKVYDIIPEYFDNEAAKRTITVGDLLTMRDGLSYENSEFDELVYHTSDSIRYILGKDLVQTPGTVFHYNDGSPMVVLAMIQKASGQNLLSYADEYLFSRLGITNYQWIQHPDKFVYGGFGLWLIPRDIAKIGLLCLNNGLWQANQIVASSWIDSATSEQVSITPRGPYGYYWWRIEGQNAYRAYGHGGQMIIVLPDLDMVAVITADSNAGSLVSDGSWNLNAFISDVTSAVVN